MEEKDEGRLMNGVVDEYWWWAAASSAQLGWGITAFRKGYAGDSRLMPFKAFAVASLFVGAAACAAMASFRASGISSVEDMKALGANIRTGLGLRPRARDE
ncbi:hypothetical protein CDL12_24941 [Handroanthus impetiginosus]|uniref:Uncharacterized protein n=1 Tax=Handroanthus impetiginosus TaxID=429701 RepID=A0A2G9GB75_9LAMI|nr:hypothetical protein CDL12_24941 [Handroanthus impetiginosus]